MEKKETAEKKFGRYIALKPLGAGGMGQVYLAEDPVLLRKLAIKVVTVNNLLDDKTKVQFLNRFLLEARASAKLNHPSIVTVFDVGQEKGIPWIAFEYIDGVRLDDMIKRMGRLPINKAIAYALDIASALDHAHENNIIHRDIKPANILIDNKTGIAKIADFGIVKTPVLGLTMEGTTLGSPGYMSPEQISGCELDTRTDIFSLGVSLYEMITGKHPFLRDTISSTAYATLNGTYIAVNRLLENIPPAVDEFIAKCLAIQREKRVGSAKEFLIRIKTVEALFPHEPARQKDMPIHAIRREPVSPGTPEFKNRAEKFLFNVAYGIITSYKFLRNTIRTLFFQKQSMPESATVVSTAKGTVKKMPKTTVTMSRRFASVSRRSTLKKRIIACIGALILFLSIVSITKHVSRSLSLKKYLKEGNITESLALAEKLDKSIIPWSYADLVSETKLLLEKNSLEKAKRIATGLTQFKSAKAQGCLLLARIEVKKRNFSDAAVAFESVKSLRDGKSILEKELPAIITNDIIPALKEDKATQSLLDLIIGTLSAVTKRRLREWVADKSYWLRWNAVYMMEAQSITVDMVNVYILDLKHAGSARTRIGAAKKLGELGDKRAIPALEEVEKNILRDPFTSNAASTVLDQYFRKNE